MAAFRVELAQVRQELAALHATHEQEVPELSDRLQTLDALVAEFQTKSQGPEGAEDPTQSVTLSHLEAERARVAEQLLAVHAQVGVDGYALAELDLALAQAVLGLAQRQMREPIDPAQLLQLYDELAQCKANLLERLARQPSAENSPAGFREHARQSALLGWQPGPSELSAQAAAIAAHHGIALAAAAEGAAPPAGIAALLYLEGAQQEIARLGEHALAQQAEERALDGASRMVTGLLIQGFGLTPETGQLDTAGTPLALAHNVSLLRQQLGVPDTAPPGQLSAAEMAQLAGMMAQPPVLPAEPAPLVAAMVGHMQKAAQLSRADVDALARLPIFSDGVTTLAELSRELARTDLPPDARRLLTMLVTPGRDGAHLTELGAALAEGGITRAELTRFSAILGQVPGGAIPTALLSRSMLTDSRTLVSHLSRDTEDFAAVRAAIVGSPERPYTQAQRQLLSVLYEATRKVDVPHGAQAHSLVGDLQSSFKSGALGSTSFAAQRGELLYLLGAHSRDEMEQRIWSGEHILTGAQSKTQVTFGGEGWDGFALRLAREYGIDAQEPSRDLPEDGFHELFVAGSVLLYDTRGLWSRMEVADAARRFNEAKPWTRAEHQGKGWGVIDSARPTLNDLVAMMDAGIYQPSQERHGSFIREGALAFNEAQAALRAYHTHRNARDWPKAQDAFGAFAQAHARLQQLEQTYQAREGEGLDRWIGNLGNAATTAQVTRDGCFVALVVAGTAGIGAGLAAGGAGATVGGVLTGGVTMSAAGGTLTAGIAAKATLTAAAIGLGAATVANATEETLHTQLGTTRTIQNADGSVRHVQGGSWAMFQERMLKDGRTVGVTAVSIGLPMGFMGWLGRGAQGAAAARAAGQAATGGQAARQFFMQQWFGQRLTASALNTTMDFASDQANRAMSADAAAAPAYTWQRAATVAGINFVVGIDNFGVGRAQGGAAATLDVAIDGSVAYSEAALTTGMDATSGIQMFATMLAARYGRKVAVRGSPAPGGPALKATPRFDANAVLAKLPETARVLVGDLEAADIAVQRARSGAQELVRRPNAATDSVIDQRLHALEAGLQAAAEKRATVLGRIDALQQSGALPKSVADALRAQLKTSPQDAALVTFMGEFHGSRGAAFVDRLRAEGILAADVRALSPRLTLALCEVLMSTHSSVDASGAPNVQHLSTVFEGALRRARGDGTPLTQADVDRIGLETVLTDALGKGRSPKELETFTTAPLVDGQGRPIGNTGKAFWQHAVETELRRVLFLDDPATQRQADTLIVETTIRRLAEDPGAAFGFVVQPRVDKLVEQGVLTKAQADSVMNAWQSSFLGQPWQAGTLLHGIPAYEPVRQAVLASGGSEADAQRVYATTLGHHMAGFVAAGFARADVRIDFDAMSRGNPPALTKEMAQKLSALYDAAIPLAGRWRSIIDNARPSLTNEQLQQYQADAAPLRAAIEALPEHIRSQLLNDDTQQFTEVGIPKWIAMMNGQMRPENNDALITASFDPARGYGMESYGRGQESGDHFYAMTRPTAERVGLKLVTDEPGSAPYFWPAEPGDLAHRKLAYGIASDTALARAYLADKGLPAMPRWTDVVENDLVAWFRARKPPDAAAVTRLTQREPEAPPVSPRPADDQPPQSAPPVGARPTPVREADFDTPTRRALAPAAVAQKKAGLQLEKLTRLSESVARETARYPGNPTLKDMRQQEITTELGRLREHLEGEQTALLAALGGKTPLSENARARALEQQAHNSEQLNRLTRAEASGGDPFTILRTLVRQSESG